MKPFTQVSGVAVPLEMPNVDTDQIIPARFLKRAKGDPAYPSFLFHDLREDPDFILNRKTYSGAQILVADRNFGCGSSREAAVYALMAGGLRTVIAPSFGDIFHSNSFKNGFLPVRLSEEVCATLRRQLADHPGAELAVDLDSQTVTGPDQTTWHFDVDPFLKLRMLKGLDDIAFTLELADEIAAFRGQYAAAYPWLNPPG